jgi:hypothetical protein
MRTRVILVAVFVTLRCQSAKAEGAFAVGCGAEGSLVWDINLVNPLRESLSEKPCSLPNTRFVLYSAP